MTVKNLRELQTFDSEKMTKQMVFEEAKSKSFILNFMPGQVLPSHSHPYTQVYVLVIEGSGECRIDDTVHSIRQGDAIHCAKSQMLMIENSSDKPMSVYVVLAREPKI